MDQSGASAVHDARVVSLTRTTPSNHGDAEVQCTYIDATNRSWNQLGLIHDGLVTKPPETLPAGLLLHTCHRVELFSTGIVSGPVVRELSEGQRIVGFAPSLARLAQIAAGTRSLIPGEQFVREQVRQAAVRLGPEHPMATFASRALALADRARDGFDLEACLDYGAVPKRWFASTPGQRSQLALVVVGSGMLSRAVISDSTSAYRTVLCVSRDPKRLRRRPPGSPSVHPVRPGAVAQILAGLRFHLVIATTNLSDDYRGVLRQLIHDPRCAATIDLCGAPVVDHPLEGYVHLHDPAVLTLLNEANTDAATRAQAAAAWIAEQAEECE